MGLLLQTILERNELFCGLPNQTLRKVSALAFRRSYGKGEVVFSQGELGDALYGVIRGKVRISASAPDGREVFLNLLKPGDTFGEIALLDGRERTATATATSASALIAIPRIHFVSLMHREPALAIHLVQLLCERIRWTSGWAEARSLMGVPPRLARRLLSLVQQHGNETKGGIQLTISQEELARFVGASRQVVNQQLQDWKAKRWVDLRRGRVTVVDARALQGIAEGVNRRGLVNPDSRPAQDSRGW
jgi:CRP-like cAMP-binding protein